MNIGSLNLNLLLAFEALFVERNVSKAAKRVRLSQPATSNALARMRALFEDPLFVSQGREMVPTAMALHLANPVLEALSRIRAAIGDRDSFDPKTATNTFRIAATDYAEIVLVSRILRAMTREAPGVSLSIMRLGGLFDIPQEKLRDGSLHFALGLFPQPVVPGARIASHILFDDPWVCIAQKKHPQIKRKLTLATFLKIEHIRVSYGITERPGLIGEALASIGRSRKIAVTVPHLATVPALAARTDLLGMVPLRLAKEYARTLSLKIYPIPVSIPRAALALLWHETSQHDPAHIWLRETIVRLSSELKPQEGPGKFRKW